MTGNGVATIGTTGATCCRITYRRFSLRLSCRAKSRHLLLLICGMARDYDFWVYIVTNRNHSVLYIGLTNSLSCRAWEHREGTGANFPAAYRCRELLYYEHYTNVHEAIARESQLKKWSRAKKVALIARLNPSWLDLSAELLSGT